MKITDFQARYSELSTANKQLTCYNMLNHTTDEQKAVKGFKNLHEWCMNQLTFDEQLAVTLPDAETLEFYKRDQIKKEDIN